jgi:hypothetical protein
MRECWYALTLALLAKDYYTPELAFDALNIGVVKRKNIIRGIESLPINKAIISTDVADMIAMKSTMTYKQIGDIYGMKADAVYNRIRRFKGII